MRFRPLRRFILRPSVQRYREGTVSRYVGTAGQTERVAEQSLNLKSVWYEWVLDHQTRAWIVGQPIRHLAVGTFLGAESFRGVLFPSPRRQTEHRAAWLGAFGQHGDGSGPRTQAARRGEGARRVRRLSDPLAIGYSSAFSITI